MSKSLILIGGCGPDDKNIIKADDYERIIAADSGYDLAKKLGIEVDLALGDFDSTKYRDELIEMGFIPCSHDKDDSDFTLALKAADGDYDLVGGGEGRIDHLLSIFSTFKVHRAPLMWITGKEIMFSSSHFKASLKKGTSLSFFPLDLTERARVSTKGLVWDLEDHDLSLSFLSLSNRAREEEIEIESDKKLFIRFDLDFFALGGKIISC